MKLVRGRRDAAAASRRVERLGAGRACRCCRLDAARRGALPAEEPRRRTSSSTSSPDQPRPARAGAADLDAGRLRRRARAAPTGRFYTQGMPEDTRALNAGVLTAPTSCWRRRGSPADENRRQFRYVLDRFTGGLLFYYFGNVDQVSHMMWRRLRPGPSRLHRGRRAVSARWSRSSTSGWTPWSARRWRGSGPTICWW